MNALLNALRYGTPGIPELRSARQTDWHGRSLPYPYISTRVFRVGIRRNHTVGYGVLSDNYAQLGDGTNVGVASLDAGIS